MTLELVAVDIGNSRAKWGHFVFGRLAHVVTLSMGDPRVYDTQLEAWGVRPTQSSDGSLAWCVASVNPEGSEPLLDWLRNRGFADTLLLNDPSLLPITVDVENPQAVGIDRLLNAVAVNDRRPSSRPAVIVDAGSAITVDAVSGSGAFLGGSIAAGLGLSARALHEFTYWLPLLEVTRVPGAIGKSTPEAMRVGLFWAAVGAVEELVRQVTTALDGEPVVYLTGGDGKLLAPYLRPVELVPDLTLRGIHLAFEYARSQRRR